MKKTKVYAMYLPQFHSIPENDIFWGKGFTDWVSVKKSQPLFEGHVQPKMPLNKNYYDLSKRESIKAQVDLANEFGVDGWGIYHYWFNNKQCLLTKPAEILLDNKDFNINFFFAWDNTSWKRSWSNVKGGNVWAPSMENSEEHHGNGIMVEYILGGKEDWQAHFDYLLPYFKDSRYEKRVNKPLFVIFHYNEEIEKMCNYWDQLAQKEGFNGMSFIFRYDDKEGIPSTKEVFKYEPVFSGWSHFTLKERILNKIHKILRGNIGPDIYDYDKIWRKLIANAKRDDSRNILHGAFVTYDDSPRRGRKGIVVNNSTPDMFQKYLSQLIDISSEQDKDYIFLTAWNEWGEGACLEPDAEYSYTYLKAYEKAKNK